MSCVCHFQLVLYSVIKKRYYHLITTYIIPGVFSGHGFENKQEMKIVHTTEGPLRDFPIYTFFQRKWFIRK